MCQNFKNMCQNFTNECQNFKNQIQSSINPNVICCHQIRIQLTQDPAHSKVLPVEDESGVGESPAEEETGSTTTPALPKQPANVGLKKYATELFRRGYELREKRGRLARRMLNIRDEEDQWTTEKNAYEALIKEQNLALPMIDLGPSDDSDSD